MSQTLLNNDITIETDALKRPVSVTLPYIVNNSVDEDAARENFEPDPDYLGLPFKKITIGQRAGADAFFVDATYQSDSYGSRETTLDAGEQEVSYNCRVQQALITQSLETLVCKNRNGGTVSFGGAIGVDKDGNVHGVQVAVPACSFSIKIQIKLGEFTRSYRNNCALLAAHVNSGNFQGYEPGEVRYDGFNASYKGTSENAIVTVTHEFTVAKNETGKSVDCWTVTKKGHDYLWLRVVETFDAQNKLKLAKPDICAVERIYPTGSFSVLRVR